MFQKNTFGASTSFGGFNSGASTSSPFGGFKPTGTASAFGAAPAFGAGTSTQPAAGGGLFGTPSTSGGLFGAPTSAAAPAPAFGASTSAGGFGFGQTSTPGGGLFGSTATTGGGLFGQTQQQSTSAFGAKPAGFGFNNASTSGAAGGGLFGSTPTTGGLFGQQNTTLGGGGLFGSPAGGFGQQQQQQQTGTAVVKFTPVMGTDTMMKGGQTTNISIKHHCITCMKEYEGKSLEELRLEDYTAGRRGAPGGGMFGGAGSAFQAPAAENKPAGGLFGAQTSTFGQPATTSSGSVFGGGGLTGGFGQTNSSFSFGGATQANAATPLFGAAKPAFGAAPATGTGLFGATTQQPAPAFGTGTSAFGFGATSQPQSTNLFGAKPATTGFGTAATPAAGGFGAFGASNTSGGLFGNKLATSAAPAFGSTAQPAFGAGGFGTTTSTAGGIFGTANTTLGAKPAGSAFGFGSTQPQQGGLGGLGTLGSNTFNQPKLGAGGSLFPTFSTGNTFATPSQNTQTFGGLGTSTLGGGLGGFGGLGSSALGNTSLGGLGAFNSGAGNAFAPGMPSGATTAGNVHEQILSLAARPYGDSPLFKDLTPHTGLTSEELLKPTNPSAIKAALDSSASYKVSPNENNRLKVLPLGPAPATNKKSLFDGLEESDSTLEERLSLKPSRKRLVLRPKNKEPETLTSTMDEKHSENMLAARHQDTASHVSHIVDTGKRRASFEGEARGINTDLEEDTERRSSWLGSRISSGSPKSKGPEIDFSPRLYPNLEKEMSTSEHRRSSWLTTKPLEKPTHSSPTAAESSVRELRVVPTLYPVLDTDDKENVDSLCGLERSLHGFCCHRAGTADSSQCEKITHQIRGIYVSEEESAIQNAVAEKPPHPTGIKLTRPGYYTVPSMDELMEHMRPDGTCVVKYFTVGRRNYGSVHYDCEMDVAGLDLDKLVHFMNKEVIVYPSEADKPPVGEGLNRRAVVTLDGVWPRDKTARCLITQPERLQKMEYEAKLRRVCDKHNTKFIEYRPETGSWVFRVEHFSKYGLTDSDEEDELPPDVLKRQLKGLPPPAAAAKPQQGLGGPIVAVGLGGPAMGLGGLGGTVSTVPLGQHSIFEDTIGHSLSATAKGLAMDTSEENSNESHSLYPDTSRVFGVKSPTSELARLDNRSTHRVQLMKASLYSDALMHDIEDNVSVSTGDQLVPQPGSPLSVDQHADNLSAVAQLLPVSQYSQEVAMRSLVVKPHTVVLRYHRRVPPFAHTIAGRMGASCIADMAICRARHARVGFAPGGRLAVITTQDRISSLPPSGELSTLGDYVAGRGAEDWSASAVTRLAVAGKDATRRPHQFQESMETHLLALLEHSDPKPSATGCPRLVVRSDPESRLKLLRMHVRHAARSRPANDDAFGVTASYWHEVWTLCEALWGSDLENGGVAGTTDMHVLTRYRALLTWLDSAVSDITQAELAQPVAADEKDETDTHSARVLTLMMGGRLLEACKVAREHGDLNMGALIAQASGDAAVRTLIERQLVTWRECGALTVISRARLLALMLCAGRRSIETGAEQLDVCRDVDWLRALNVQARYLCPQVSSVEEIVRAYEGCFARRSDADIDEEVDLAAMTDGREGLEYPLPPYSKQFDVTVQSGGVTRRVLDLRYELLRARAFDTRPNVQAASYTPDTLDYSLSFLVGAWLGNVSVAAIAGISEQLAASGAWHLAVLPLLYHPDDNARAALVRGVISRHAPALADTPDARARLDFLRALRVPEKWILLAQAHRAKYEHLPAVEAEHLAGAGEWNAAHRVLLEELLPQAVLADELEQLSPLVERLNEAGERSEVSGWEHGGKALYHYLHVCKEIRGLDNGDSRNAVHARVESLRPRVALACRALSGLTTRTPRHAAARTELGARLVRLAVCAGAGGAHLAALLRALKLPPDAQQHVLQKITMEVATEASESCAATAELSPVSAHPRLHSVVDT